MRRRLAAVPVLMALVAGPASAQMDSREGIALQNQILELRRDLRVLREQGGAGGYVPPPASGGAATSDLTAQLLNRVTALEDSVRQLRGRLDEADNARQRQLDDMSKRVGDLEFRAGGGTGTPPAATPRSAPGGVLTPPAGVTPSAPAAPTGPVRRTPEIALQDGNAALSRRDYTGAEAAAREVLAGAKGPRSTDAHYLLAQALVGQRNYQAAAVSFDDTYQRNPKGSRAADSLIGLANSLSAINERKSACQTLDKLRAEFPSVRPDLRPLIAAARQRAACG